MNTPSCSEIDDAITGFTAMSLGELQSYTAATCGSLHFQAEVRSAMKLIIDGHCVSETIWALMIVMLWAGVTIERKRHEISALDRIYESGPVV